MTPQIVTTDDGYKVSAGNFGTVTFPRYEDAARFARAWSELTEAIRNMSEMMAITEE